MQVWAVDLDLRYSDQLALTQLLLVVTGATLDCRSCRLLVPLPTQEKSPESPSKVLLPVPIHRLYLYLHISTLVLTSHVGVSAHGGFSEILKFVFCNSLVQTQ